MYKKIFSVMAIIMISMVMASCNGKKVDETNKDIKSTEVITSANNSEQDNKTDKESIENDKQVTDEVKPAEQPAKPEEKPKQDAAAEKSQTSKSENKSVQTTNTAVNKPAVQQTEPPKAQQTAPKPATSQQESPKQEVPKVVVGIDSTLTNQLRNLVVAESSTYIGIKKGEFSNIAQQVALNQKSTSEAVNKIQSMSWEEEAKNIDKYLSGGVSVINTRNVRCIKFNVPGNKSASDIALQNNFNLGQYGEVFAYRNADNTVTITSLGCDFTSTPK